MKKTSLVTFSLFTFGYYLYYRPRIFYRPDYQGENMGAPEGLLGPLRLAWKKQHDLLEQKIQGLLSKELVQSLTRNST